MFRKKILKKSSIPRNLQSVLWSSDIRHLDLKKDKGYIIHQILLYGTFEEIKWLFETYSKKEIINVFVNHPSKIYPKEIFNFVKNYILPLRHLSLSQDKYVTSIHGPIRPRAAGNL